MIGRSEWTVEKFEGGQVLNPNVDTEELFLALVELGQLYRAQFGKKKYMVKTALERPDPFFGGLTGYEFATKTPDGIFKLLGFEKRKYA